MKAERNHLTLRTIFLLIAVCLAGSRVSANNGVQGKYGGGGGTQQVPYRITRAADLILLGESPEDYDKHFILTADIDLDPNLPGCRVFDRAVIAPDTNDANWEFEGTPFTGVFDGDGHTISHLTIVGSSHLGLFGQLGSRTEIVARRVTIQVPAQVKRLGVVDVNIIGLGRHIGTLAAYNDTGTITQCHSTGMVMNDWLLGGLVGTNDGIVADSYSACTVHGSAAGGLVGSNSGSIIGSYSTGTVKGDYYIGGLIGNNDGKVMNSYSTGSVDGADYCVGGLVGDNHGTIMSSHSTSRVGGCDNVGGLVGQNSGCITTSYSSGTVEWGHWGIGGLVGVNNGCISVCWSDGKTSGHREVGGLAGENSGSIIACHSAGIIDGDEYIGRLAGYGGGIVMCYSIAVLAGHKNIEDVTEDGWFCARNFWDREVSGGATNGEARDLTTAQMKDINTYLNAGWDFVGEDRNGTCNYWQISPGEYPRLAWFEGNRPVMPEGLGTPEQPYLIRNARDLGTVWSEPMAHYRLAESVDLFGIVWSTAVIPFFGGTFDGNRQWIWDLHIQGEGHLGLFGELAVKAAVSDLRLQDVEISGIGSRVGGLAGVSRGAIADCVSNGLVSGSWAVGGLLGGNDGSIRRSRSTAVVTGGSSAGGLVGSNGSRATVIASHSDGIVLGSQGIGGLVGESYGGRIDSCSSACMVRGDRAVGGLLGEGEGVWEADRDQKIVTACYSASAVIGEEEVGGLIGRFDWGQVSCCYSIGVIMGGGHVGGLIGSMGRGDVNECYSASAVGGRSNVGGLTGSADDSTVIRCLWDSQVCGQTAGGGIAKTTVQMQTKSTFMDLGWDFSPETVDGTGKTWWIDEGRDYPRLWWENGGERGDSANWPFF